MKYVTPLIFERKAYVINLGVFVVPRGTTGVSLVFRMALHDLVGLVGRR